jgi:hypothetical protein
MSHHLDTPLAAQTGQLLEYEDLTYRVSFGEPDADGRQPRRDHRA